jgi:hypothetical protein
MNPYLAGFLLGLVLLTTIFVTGHGLGASGAIKSFAAASLGMVDAEHARGLEFFHQTPGTSPLKSWLVFEIIGVIVGAFLSGVVANRLTFKVEHPPNVKNNVRLSMALFGGVLFGFGAQLARGCTSGAALSGMAVMSLGGILTMMAIFGSAYAVAFFFRKLWI